MKGEIVNINKNFNTVNCRYFYEISIEIENLPDLKLGECEVIQK